MGFWDLLYHFLYHLNEFLRYAEPQFSTKRYEKYIQLSFRFYHSQRTAKSIWEQNKIYHISQNRDIQRCSFYISQTLYRLSDNLSKDKDGIREIYHQKFINPHSSGVTNQMHGWGLSLSYEFLESCYHIVVTFVSQLLIGSQDQIDL